MVKFQGFIAVFAIALMLYAFVDCAMRDETQIKKLPKWGWLLVIIIFSTFGSIAYLVIGRVGKLQKRTKKSKPRIIPPDDNPDFLRGL
jgi:choline-glycine betaine transporter